MGSMPRLKIKDELHYRPGSTNESENCRYCKNYFKSLNMRNESGTAIEEKCGRCKLIGFNSGARYKVRPDYKCDAQELDRDRCPWMREKP